MALLVRAVLTPAEPPKPSVVYDIQDMAQASKVRRLAEIRAILMNLLYRHS